MKKSMKVRIAFGAVMMAVIVGLLYWDWHLQDTSATDVIGWPMAALVALLAAVGFLEIDRMARAVGASTLRVSGLLCTVGLATVPVWGQAVFHIMLPMGGLEFTPVLLMTFGLMAIFFEQMAVHRTEDAMRRIAATTLGVMYVGMGSCLVLNLRVELGVPFLVLFLAAVKFTDIGAYFTGSFLGKHKLIPWLSPGKTWEGLAGGLVFAAVVSVLVAWALKIDRFGPVDHDAPLAQYLAAGVLWRYVLFGVLVGAVGQFADLCESLLKRAAGVKDSGALVPEFGGVLDIADSPLLSVPVALLFVTAMKFV